MYIPTDVNFLTVRPIHTDLQPGSEFRLTVPVHRSLSGVSNEYNADKSVLYVQL